MNNSSSVVTYNGITLNRVLIRGYDCEPVYEESNTDQTGDKNTISVSSFYSSNVDNGLGISAAGKTAAEMCALIKHKLTRPRCNLLFTVGGVTIVESSKDLDVQNGPKVSGCRVTSVTGTELFKVDFVVETVLSPCDDQTSGTEGTILSNRWEIVEDVDDSSHTSRTINGTVVFSKANGSYNAVRGAIIPPLNIGYVRDSLMFTRARDGLSMNYSWKDRQVWAVAPSPAYAWDAKHTIDYSPLEGQGLNTLTSSVDVMLKGPPGIGKSELFRVALTICEIKLQRDKNNQPAPENMVIQLVLIDNMNESSVSVSAKALMALDFTNQVIEDIEENGISAASGFAIGSSLAGALQGYKQGTACVPQVPDGTIASAFICKVVSTCEPKPGPNPGTVPAEKLKDVITSGNGVDDSASGSGPSTENGGITVVTGNTKSTPSASVLDGSTLADGAKKDIYVNYRIDSRYETELSRAHCAGGEATVIIEFAAPKARRTIRIFGTRASSYPPIPAHVPYNESDNNIAYPIGTPKIVMAQPQVSGGLINYTVSCEMEWALQRAPTTRESLRGCTLPFDSLRAVAVGIGPSDQFAPGGDIA